MTPLRIVGAVLVVTGLVLVFVPTLVQDPGPAADTFEAIERHVRWGALVGIGALLLARTQLRPWGITIASFVLWIDLGYLVARCIGLALEGTDSDRQWMWLGIEVVIAVAAGAYLWSKRARPADVPDASA